MANTAWTASKCDVGKDGAANCPRSADHGAASAAATQAVDITSQAGLLFSTKGMEAVAAAELPLNQLKGVVRCYVWWSCRAVLVGL